MLPPNLEDRLGPLETRLTLAIVEAENRIVYKIASFVLLGALMFMAVVLLATLHLKR